MTDVKVRSATPRPDIRTAWTVWAAKSRPDLLEHAAMVAVLVIWAVPFTRATGGRGVHNELLFAGALVLLLPALRAWRAPARAILLGAAVAVAALLVCVFAPTEWYGSDAAAGYAIAAAVFVAARRYVRDSDRRMLVAASVCLAGLYQFSQAFTAWWGSRNAATEMSGTFYWHNPYAAFLLPGALVGLGLVISRRYPWTIVGWVCTPLCSAGIVFSGSRATIAALFVGFVLLLACCVRNRAALVRGIGGLAVTAGVTMVLPGPPFFPRYTAPWTSTAAHNAQQSLSQNGGFRTEFWREALQVFAHHPVVGSGFHALATASALYTPGNWARSPLAHDGYLQSLTDGGVLLAVPFLLAVGIVVIWAFRPLLAAVRTRLRGDADVVVLSLAVAMLAGLAHSAVDFDWSHPSILVEAALLAACLAPAASPIKTRGLRVPALVALAGVLVVLIPALHQWQRDVPNLRHSTEDLLANANATFGDYRPAQSVMYAYVDQARPLTQAQAALALALTSREATVDLHLALLREAVGAQTGLITDPVGAARRILSLVDGSTAPYVPDFALVLVEAGQAQTAQRTLAQDIAAQAAGRVAAPSLNLELMIWAQHLGTGGSYGCQLRVANTVPDTDLSSLPKPTAACPEGDQGRP